jgi:hypothetical protein
MWPYAYANVSLVLPPEAKSLAGGMRNLPVTLQLPIQAHIWGFCPQMIFDSPETSSGDRGSFAHRKLRLIPRTEGSGFLEPAISRGFVEHIL